jgi:N,N'-diacetyllegionaminate synthase
MVIAPDCVTIDGRRVGPGQRCFVIAEAGVNHNGNVELALAMVEAAAKAGADAVKFQTFKAIRLVTLDAPKCDYQVKNTGAAESQFEMLRRLELSPASHERIVARCRELNVAFLSTPFDEESLDFLKRLGVPALKIASGELTNLPLLARAASTGLPLIVSTGMATIGEVEQAMETIEAAGARQVVLLHCVSNYPAAPADVNLRAMATMQTAFQAPVGYSDHTEGNEVALAAVALGACVVEKHFTLDRGLPGPDHVASLEPQELATLVRQIRTVESALGAGRKTPAASEASTAAAARKSLVAAEDIPAGAIISSRHLAIMRPGSGLPPALREQLLDRVARRDIPAGTVIKWDMVA